MVERSAGMMWHAQDFDEEGDSDDEGDDDDEDDEEDDDSGAWRCAMT